MQASLFMQPGIVVEVVVDVVVDVLVFRARLVVLLVVVVVVVNKRFFVVLAGKHLQAVHLHFPVFLRVSHETP